MHEIPPHDGPNLGPGSRVTHDPGNGSTFTARSFRSRRVSGINSRFRSVNRRRSARVRMRR
jgi:hypothetical protein